MAKLWRAYPTRLALLLEAYVFFHKEGLINNLEHGFTYKELKGFQRDFQKRGKDLDRWKPEYGKILSRQPKLSEFKNPVFFTCERDIWYLDDATLTIFSHSRFWDDLKEGMKIEVAIRGIYERLKNDSWEDYYIDQESVPNGEENVKTSVSSSLFPYLLKKQIPAGSPGVWFDYDGITLQMIKERKYSEIVVSEIRQKIEDVWKEKKIPIITANPACGKSTLIKVLGYFWSESLDKYVFRMEASRWKDEFSHFLKFYTEVKQENKMIIVMLEDLHLAEEMPNLRQYSEEEGLYFILTSRVGGFDRQSLYRTSLFSRIVIPKDYILELVRKYLLNHPEEIKDWNFLQGLISGDQSANVVYLFTEVFTSGQVTDWETWILEVIESLSAKIENKTYWLVLLTILSHYRHLELECNKKTIGAALRVLLDITTQGSKILTNPLENFKDGEILENPLEKKEKEQLDVALTILERKGYLQEHYRRDFVQIKEEPEVEVNKLPFSEVSLPTYKFREVRKPLGYYSLSFHPEIAKKIYEYCLIRLETNEKNQSPYQNYLDLLPVIWHIIQLYVQTLTSQSENIEIKQSDVELSLTDKFCSITNLSDYNYISEFLIQRISFEYYSQLPLDLVYSDYHNAYPFENPQLFKVEQRLKFLVLNFHQKAFKSGLERLFLEEDSKYLVDHTLLTKYSFPDTIPNNVRDEINLFLVFTLRTIPTLQLLRYTVVRHISQHDNHRSMGEVFGLFCLHDQQKFIENIKNLLEEIFFAKCFFSYLKIILSLPHEVLTSLDFNHITNILETRDIIPFCLAFIRIKEESFSTPGFSALSRHWRETILPDVSQALQNFISFCLLNNHSLFNAESWIDQNKIKNKPEVYLNSVLETLGSCKIIEILADKDIFLKILGSYLHEGTYWRRYTTLAQDGRNDEEINDILAVFPISYRLQKDINNSDFQFSTFLNEVPRWMYFRLYTLFQYNYLLFLYLISDEGLNLAALLNPGYDSEIIKLSLDSKYPDVREQPDTFRLRKKRAGELISFIQENKAPVNWNRLFSAILTDYPSSPALRSFPQMMIKEERKEVNFGSLSESEVIEKIYEFVAKGKVTKYSRSVQDGNNKDSLNFFFSFFQYLSNKLKTDKSAIKEITLDGINLILSQCKETLKMTENHHDVGDFFKLFMTLEFPEDLFLHCLVSLLDFSTPLKKEYVKSISAGEISKLLGEKPTYMKLNMLKLIELKWPLPITFSKICSKLTLHQLTEYLALYLDISALKGSSWTKNHRLGPLYYGYPVKPTLPWSDRKEPDFLISSNRFGKYKLKDILKELITRIEYTEIYDFVCIMYFSAIIEYCKISPRLNLSMFWDILADVLKSNKSDLKEETLFEYLTSFLIALHYLFYYSNMKGKAAPPSSELTTLSKYIFDTHSTKVIYLEGNAESEIRYNSSLKEIYTDIVTGIRRIFPEKDTTDLFNKKLEALSKTNSLEFLLLLKIIMDDFSSQAIHVFANVDISSSIPRKELRDTSTRALFLLTFLKDINFQSLNFPFNFEQLITEYVNRFPELLTEILRWESYREFLLDLLSRIKNQLTEKITFKLIYENRKLSYFPEIWNRIKSLILNEAPTDSTCLGVLSLRRGVNIELSSVHNDLKTWIRHNDTSLRNLFHDSHHSFRIYLYVILNVESPEKWKDFKLFLEDCYNEQISKSSGQRDDEEYEIISSNYVKEVLDAFQLPVKLDKDTILQYYCADMSKFLDFLETLDLPHFVYLIEQETILEKLLEQQDYPRIFSRYFTKNTLMLSLFDSNSEFPQIFVLNASLQSSHVEDIVDVVKKDEMELLFEIFFAYPKNTSFFSRTILLLKPHVEDIEEKYVQTLRLIRTRLLERTAGMDIVLYPYYYSNNTWKNKLVSMNFLELKEKLPFVFNFLVSTFNPYRMYERFWHLSNQQLISSLLWFFYDQDALAQHRLVIVEKQDTYDDIPDYVFLILIKYFPKLIDQRLKREIGYLWERIDDTNPSSTLKEEYDPISLKEQEVSIFHRKKKEIIAAWIQQNK